jgi:amidase
VLPFDTTIRTVRPPARHRRYQVPYNDQSVWAGIATLNGLPATTAPIGRTESGLPIGVQIIGRYLEDRTTIAFAGLVEREFGGFTPPPIK